MPASDSFPQHTRSHRRRGDDLAGKRKARAAPRRLARPTVEAFEHECHPLLLTRVTSATMPFLCSPRRTQIVVNAGASGMERSAVGAVPERDSASAQLRRRERGAAPVAGSPLGPRSDRKAHGPDDTAACSCLTASPGARRSAPHRCCPSRHPRYSGGRVYHEHDLIAPAPVTETSGNDYVGGRAPAMVGIVRSRSAGRTQSLCTFVDRLQSGTALVLDLQPLP